MGIGIGSMGLGEMALIAVVAVVLFGGRLPEVARTFGGYYSQFRKSLADIQNSIKTDLDVSQELNEVPRILHESLDFDDEDAAPSFDPPSGED